MNDGRVIDIPAIGTAMEGGRFVGLIMLPTGKCDIHPSPAGQAMLAGAILQTIANSCPAHNATRCLNRHQD